MEISPGRTAAYPYSPASGRTKKMRTRRMEKRPISLLRERKPPKIRPERMSMMPIVMRIWRVPIHETRKNPVAKVPRMEPRVEKA